MISIQTNVNSLVAQQNLSVNSAFQSKTIAQLTSGYRINQSGDDAAGLAVANKFRSSVAELTQGVANGNDAVAQLQIMDGGMSNISQILDRLKTLATQSASGAFTGNRATLNAEFQTDLAEIDRQAQSIGLDTGGTFAKSLSVYLGQGSGSGAGQGGTQALMNASVVVDLSRATVDSGSLGLKGLKAIAGTVDSAGTDIGTGSSNGTTVQDIVSARAGNTEAKAGYATFNLSGPGFSDNSKVAVSANLSGVSDVNGLVAAINTAIANAGNGTTQSAQALKSAGVVASVNTDQYGHQQLAFSSASTAFQVQAGDQMANALMGNFASPGSATGKAVTSTVTGGTAGVGTAAFDPTNVSVQISGAGLAGPVTLKLSSSDHTVSAATSDVINQVKQSKQLQDAGISVSLGTNNKLEFTNANGSTFNVASAGDTTNALGLGTFVTTSALNGAVAYSDITAGTSLSAAATGNGIATLGFSLNGGATGGITAATVTGSVTGTGYNGAGTPDGTVSNAAGGLGSMTLSVNDTVVTVDFSKDANQSATETVQQAANFINSQIQSKLGYGSDVKLASVDTATNTIKLSGSADGAGTIVASGSAAGALGLTAATGANIVAASGEVGNTVSVNLAGGNASSAVATGTVAAPANIATGTNKLQLVIDGVDINADFSQDVNSAGEAAAFTSGVLGLSGAASTIDVSALQGEKASLTGGVVGGAGTDSTLALGQFAAQLATITGSAVGGPGAGSGASKEVDLTGFVANAATVTGASLGAVATGDVDLTSLDLAAFGATKAKATSGALGSSGATSVGTGYSLDVNMFKATKAAVTGADLGAADGSSAVNFTAAFGATKAVLTADHAVAADDTSAVAALTALGTGAGDKLIINGTSITIKDAANLAAVVSAINTDATIGVPAGGVIASAVGGVLKITNKIAGAASPISVVANAGSLAVGLSQVGQVADSTATGAGTKATMTGYSVHGDNSTAVQAITDLTSSNKLQINGGTAFDISGATSLTNLATIIEANDATINATANANGTITLTNKVAGAGKIVVTNNLAAQATGLGSIGDPDKWAQGTGLAELQLSLDGKQTINVDLSAANTGTKVVDAINNAIKDVATGYGAGYNSAVAALDTSGNLVITSKNTGGTGASAGEVKIIQNGLSDALGLTSSGSVDKFGKDLEKLVLNIDGKGDVAVDISSATTLTDIAAAITGAVAGDAGYSGDAAYNSVASAATGSIVITGVVKGQAGTVKITDNAVAQALNLTSGGGDIETPGVDAKLLKLNIDGIGEVDVDVSGATSLTANTSAGLNKLINDATTQKNGAYVAVASASSTTNGQNAGLTLTGRTTGSTLGKVTVIGNEVSDALKLTSGTTVGKDATTLDLTIDGKSTVHIDLSGLATTATLTQIADKINTELRKPGADGALYDSVADAATTAGSIRLDGVALGGSITVADNLIAQKLGLTSGTGAAVNSGAAQTLKIQIDGNQEVSLDLSDLGTAEKGDIAAAINTRLVAAGYDAAKYGSAVTANSNGSFTLKGAAGGGTITVKNSTLTNELGLTSNSSNATNTGTAGQTLGISIDGKATTQVSFADLAGTASLNDIANAINTALTNDAAYGATYANASANADGTITIASLGKGSVGGTVTIANDAAGQELGLTSGPAASNTVQGKDESIEDVASFLNKTAQQTLGTSTDAKIVTLDASGSISIASQTKGASSSVSIDSAGTTGNLAGALQLGGYLDYATTGSARSLQSVVDSLKQAFNSNSTLQQAGLTAQINQATQSLEIKSSNGTEFRLDAWGTKTATTDADLGFGDTGKAFTNALAPTVSSSSTVSVQGASAIGTSANGTHNTTSIAFQGMQFGNDDQSITIAANSAAGVAQTPLTITLQNDSDAQTGATIDSAISAINTKLQQSNNATLRSITAVQETGADGKESINFISSLSSFSVSVGSSAGAAVGDGLNGGVAKTFSSATNGASSSIAIDTQAGAQQAVTALGTAIAALGSAQGTIGRGQNQLTYAISLATSQITNFSAAESQIRDTNVAQQAANLSKATTLSQASIAAMAQANSAPQAVLSLLRG